MPAKNIWRADLMEAADLAIDRSLATGREFVSAASRRHANVAWRVIVQRVDVSKSTKRNMRAKVENYR